MDDDEFGDLLTQLLPIPPEVRVHPTVAASEIGNFKIHSLQQVTISRRWNNHVRSTPETILRVRVVIVSIKAKQEGVKNGRLTNVPNPSLNRGSKRPRLRSKENRAGTDPPTILASNAAVATKMVRLAPCWRTLLVTKMT
jgi:hypothetical protein